MYKWLINNYMRYKSHTIMTILDTAELGWSSLRSIAKYYEIFYNIKISHETIRKALIVIEGNEIDFKLPELSGYFGYDAQWVRINKK